MTAEKKMFSKLPEGYSIREPVFRYNPHDAAKSTWSVVLVFDNGAEQEFSYFSRYEAVWRAYDAAWHVHALRDSGKPKEKDRLFVAKEWMKDISSKNSADTNVFRLQNIVYLLLDEIEELKKRK